MSRSLALACALALSACAGPPAPEQTPGAPAANAKASPERARFERWKQDAAAGDPRADFARQAEAEAERRRSEALSRSAAPAAASVEAELVGDGLAELGAGASGCFEEGPELSGQDDWIRHRELTRADFLAPEPSPAAQPVASIPSAEVGAVVVIRFACVVQGELSEPEPGRFVVDVERFEYLALLSRRLSWWNPEFGDDEWVLRHEQLHFDVAELIAHELSEPAGGPEARLRGVGPDPQAAMADFRGNLAEHMREQQVSFQEIELAYDRETRHGHDVARQTEWFARVKRGLAAVRAGLATKPVLIEPSADGR